MSQFPDVDLIGRAAALIRQRATAASRSPWRRSANGSVFHSGPSASKLNQRWGTYVLASVGAWDLGRPSNADADHITSWHPQVALAVADWLDIGANKYACVDRPPMLAVARAYLGEPGPDQQGDGVPGWKAGDPVPPHPFTGGGTDSEHCAFMIKRLDAGRNEGIICDGPADYETQTQPHCHGMDCCWYCHAGTPIHYCAHVEQAPPGAEETP